MLEKIPYHSHRTLKSDSMKEENWGARTQKGPSRHQANCQQPGKASNRSKTSLKAG